MFAFQAALSFSKHLELVSPLHVANVCRIIHTHACKKYRCVDFMPLSPRAAEWYQRVQSPPSRQQEEGGAAVLGAESLGDSPGEPQMPSEHDV